MSSRSSSWRAACGRSEGFTPGIAETDQGGVARHGPQAAQAFGEVPEGGARHADHADAAAARGRRDGDYGVRVIDTRRRGLHAGGPGRPRAANT